MGSNALKVGLDWWCEAEISININLDSVTGSLQKKGIYGKVATPDTNCQIWYMWQMQP